MVNAISIVTGTKMNPMKTIVLLYIISYPYFYRLEQSLSDAIDDAFKQDHKLTYYTHKSKRLLKK